MCLASRAQSAVQYRISLSFWHDASQSWHQAEVGLDCQVEVGKWEMGNDAAPQRHGIVPTHALHCAKDPSQTVFSGQHPNPEPIRVLPLADGRDRPICFPSCFVVFAKEGVQASIGGDFGTLLFRNP